MLRFITENRIVRHNPNIPCLLGIRPIITGIPIVSLQPIESKTAFGRCSQWMIDDSNDCEPGAFLHNLSQRSRVLDARDRVSVSIFWPANLVPLVSCSVLTACYYWYGSIRSGEVCRVLQTVEI